MSAKSPVASDHATERLHAVYTLLMTIAQEAEQQPDLWVLVDVPLLIEVAEADMDDIEEGRDD